MRAKKTIKVGRVPRPGVPLWLLCSLLFALCALRSPAAGFVREDGRYSVTNIGGTTVTYTLANAVPQGNTLVVFMGVEASVVQPSNSIPIIDSRGNTYTLVAGTIDNSVHQANMVVGYIATALQAGDTLTMNWTNNGAITFKSAGAIEVFSGLANTAPDLAITNSSYGTNFTAKGTNTVGGDVLVGVVWDQANFQPTNFTWTQIGPLQSYAYQTNSTTGLCQGFAYTVAALANASNNFSGAYYETNCGCLSNASWAVTWVALKPSGTAYYVDPVAGLDSNAGTSTALAFQHCPGDSNATSTASTTILTNGCTVYFKPGLTNFPHVICITNSGSPSAPITYEGQSSWAAGQAIIDCATNYYNSFYVNRFLGQQNNIVIDGFDIRNAKNINNDAEVWNMVPYSADVSPNTNFYALNGMGSGSGGYVRGCIFAFGTNWMISNCRIHEFENCYWRSLATGATTNDNSPCDNVGISFAAGGGAGYGVTNGTISNCVIWATGQAATYEAGSNILVINCDFGGDSAVPATNRGWFTEPFQFAGGVTNSRMTGCRIHDFWQYQGDDSSQRGHAGDGHFFGADHGTYAVTNAAADPMGVVLDHNFWYCDHAFQYANGTGFLYFETGVIGVTCYDNIFVNTFIQSIRAGGQLVTNISLFNNTIITYNPAVSGGTYPLYFTSSSISGFKSRNNIFYQQNQNSVAMAWTMLDPIGANSIDSDYNSFFTANMPNVIRWQGTNIPLSTWTADTGLDTHSITNPPMFLSLPATGATASSGNYGLTNGSPGIAAGVDVSAYGVTNDFNNVLWSGVYDLGAIKYTGQGGGGGGGSSGPTLSGVHY